MSGEIGIHNSRFFSIAIVLAIALLCPACQIGSVDMAVGGPTAPIDATTQKVWKAWNEDSGELTTKMKSVIGTDRLGIKMFYYRVFGWSDFGLNPGRLDGLTNLLGVKPVIDRKDPDIARHCSELDEPAGSFQSGSPEMKAFKVTGHPQQLRLSSGRSFEHALLFYNSNTSHAFLQVGYGSTQDVLKAEYDYRLYSAKLQDQANHGTARGW